MPIIKSAKYIAQKVERFFVYRVLSLDDTPHRIALGVAIGMFVTWTPTIGFQMLLTVGLSWLFRANKVVGVPFVWISNPLTIIPIYLPAYYIGCWVLGKEPDAVEKINEAVKWGNEGWSEKVSHWFSTIGSIFWELWLGSLMLAGIVGFISYFIIYYMVIAYRKKWHKKHDPEIAEQVKKTNEKSQEPQLENSDNSEK